MLIIASLVLAISGCGHKGSPFYTDEPIVSDENVEFIIISEENNASRE